MQNSTMLVYAAAAAAGSHADVQVSVHPYIVGLHTGVDVRAVYTALTEYATHHRLSI